MEKAVISIIEDHKMVRENVIQFIGLHEEFSIGAVCRTAEDYFKELKHNPDFKTDVLLLDIGQFGWRKP